MAKDKTIFDDLKEELFTGKWAHRIMWIIMGLVILWVVIRAREDDARREGFYRAIEMQEQIERQRR